MKKSFIKNFLAIFYILIFAFYSGATYAADVAGILPQGKTQFLDSNGKPLSSGTVKFTIPATQTLKTTWQDAAETIPNANPVVLDAAGRATIWGFGSYRQQVFDRNSNLIWDVVTASAGSGSSGGSTVGDGNLVGTVLPWTGLVAPPNYLFAYGEEIARVTYPEFLAAITSIQAVFCTSGSPILTGIGDTTQLPIGAAVEASCIAAGATIISKTSNSVTVSVNANTSTNLLATFFPWGNGNGTTTFNVPDYRGRTIAGRDNMGGVAASRLTATYFANASAIGATGGGESQTLLIANLAAHTHSVFIRDPGHTHTGGANTATTVANFTSGGVVATAVPNQAATASSTTGIHTNSVNGGSAGTDDATASTGSATPFSRVQPTITANFIVKVTPDVSASTATGVASLGGMTGVIACGSTLTCSANTISLNGSILNIPNSQLATAAANTFKGNATASTASVTDFTIAGLTNKASPAGSDLLIISDQAASGAFKQILVSSIAAATGVASIAGNTGVFTLSTGITNSTNDIRVDKATAANYYAATSNKVVTADVIYPSEVTITFGATTTFDMNTFINGVVTLTGNITTATFTNIKAGQSGMITFIQDATGSRTLPATFNANFKFASGIQPVLSTAANAIDIIFYSCRTTSYCVASLNKAFS